MHSCVRALAVLAIGIMAGSAQALEYLVDDFEENGFALAASEGGSDFANVYSPVYFDDFRQVFLQAFGMPESTVTSAPGAGDDALVVTTGAGANVSLTYGASDPNADFSAFTAIEVVVTAAPSAGKLNVRFGNPEGDAQDETPFAGPGTYSFPFAAMTTTGGFDFTSVDRIYVSIGAASDGGHTFAISKIRIVPEAGAGSVTAFAALGALAARRRARAEVRPAE